MPLYDYQCDDCRRIFEARTPMDQKVVECSRCGRVATRVFPQRVNFKQWYQNFSADCWHLLREMDIEIKAKEIPRRYNGFTPKE